MNAHEKETVITSESESDNEEPIVESFQSSQRKKNEYWPRTKKKE